MKFQPVPSHPNFFDLQSKILKFWEKNKVFEKSIAQRSKDNLYSFYDGPPFVTGSPHYGTLLSSIAKDIIPRYFTMKGKRIRRVWGWDCHGLPIENKVEEKLGLANRRDIEKAGIKRFIESCYDYVSKSSPEWQWYVDHVGRWVDFENAYKTMDQDYMETVIWVFKQIYDRGLIYKGKRTSLFCTRCSTPISNFEIAMDNSYADMQDPAVTVEFKVASHQQENTGDWGLKTGSLFLLAWTTTPWTLPANRALVIDPDETYVAVKGNDPDNQYILAKKRLKAVFGKDKYKIVKTFKGKELIGLSYEPLYDFFPKKKGDFKVHQYKNMVNMDEGTGIVHSAPGFGEIDTEMGRHYELSMVDAVDDEGKFTKAVKPWAGTHVKKADPKIIEDLEKKDRLFKKETITHSYPYCYRCKTPLIYKAQSSWFINVQKLKKQLLKTNKNINWVPQSANNRFKKGIENAPDWCISRTRYWATPMPIWQCDKCKERKVLGSISEIEKLSGQKVKDLHRPFIDKITIKCQKCNGVMHRIREVLDCWMESGSMPYGERHYPFENKKEFEKGFPADYISEYVAQTRAWFYVMHAVSNALMDTHCFKNVVSTGVIFGSDGRKMSKSYGNYPNPKKTLEKYGGDVLRLYLMGSPIMVGENINISEEKIENAYKKTLLILWNSYRYFVTFANLVPAEYTPEVKSLNTSGVDGLAILDSWILARLKLLCQKVTQSFDKYLVPPAVNEIVDFVTDLSTWYIRRSRDRFNSQDKKALKTLYFVLVTFSKIAAPVIPFTTESIFRNLTGKQSVHLEDWPKLPEPTAGEKKLLKQMKLVRQICSEGNRIRKEEGIPLRQPLKSCKAQGSSLKLTDKLAQLIKEELNVKKVILKKTKTKKPCPVDVGLKVSLDLKLTPPLKKEGRAREIIREIQKERGRLGCKRDQKVIVYLPSWPKEFEEEIKRKALVRKLIKGKFKISNF